MPGIISPTALMVIVFGKVFCFIIDGVSSGIANGNPTDLVGLVAAFNRCDCPSRIMTPILIPRYKQTLIQLNEREFDG